VIVVDTSVWIDAHRHPTRALAATLKRLLDADEVALALPVRLELAAGISRRDRAALLRALSSLPLVRPTDDTWNLIEQWIPVAAEKGQRFGQADWLIAALTSEIGALVWSLDEDFAALERLKLVNCYCPSG
jgi:predicted nucleic acid-binding protein